MSETVYSGLDYRTSLAIPGHPPPFKYQTTRQIERMNEKERQSRMNTTQIRASGTAPP